MDAHAHGADAARLPSSPAPLAVTGLRSDTGVRLVLHGSGDLSHVFLALSAALVAFGLINAGGGRGRGLDRPTRLAAHPPRPTR